MRLTFTLLSICLLLALRSAVAQPSDSTAVTMDHPFFSKTDGLLSKGMEFQAESDPFGSSETSLNIQNHFNSVPMTRAHSGSEYEYLEHPGVGTNVPFASVTDASGNTFITGGGSNLNNPEGDFTTIKVDPSGTIVWTVSEPGTEFSQESGRVIALSDTGDVIVGGTVWNGNNLDVRVIKYDKDSGNILWETTYDNGYGTVDAPGVMALDDDGNIVLAGVSYTGVSMEFLVLKFNSNGTLLWAVTDTNPIEGTWNEPTAMRIDSSGNIAITGVAGVDGTSAGYWEGYLTLLYDADGEQIWRNSYLFQRHLDENDPNSELINTHASPRGVAFDSQSNIYVSGTFDVSGNPRMGTIKYDANGEEIWIKSYRAGAEGSDITNGHGIEISPADDIYVVGRHRAGWVDEGVVLISYFEDGEVNWVSENDNLIQISEAKIILSDNNTPIVAGMGYDENTSDIRIRVFKYSPTGAIEMETSYLKPYSSIEGIRKFVNLTTDENEMVYLTLNNYYTSKGDVFETVKLPFDSGANNPEWTSIFETPGSGSNTRMLSGIPGMDNSTYITGDYGVIENDVYYRNFFVAKYDEAGNVEWQKAFSELNNNKAAGIRVLEDSEGNLIVFLLPNPQDDFPYKLKKYSSSGELQWEVVKEVYSSEMQTFFLDKNDAIFVAGSSKEDSTDPSVKFLTVKYEADGTEAWADFVVSDNPDDFIYDLKSGIADDEGNVYLTGMSGISTMFSQEVDLTVLKYTSAGDLLWLKKISQENYVSSGIDLVLDEENFIYLAAIQEQTMDLVEELWALKLSPDGDVIWQTTYGQSDLGRRISPYAIFKTSEGHVIIPSYSLYWVPGEPTNNRISVVQLDGATGDIQWERNSETERYYADSFLDDSDHFYVVNQTGENDFKILGSNLTGALLEFNANGEIIEETFYRNDERAHFDPKTLVGLDNGKLLMGGTLYGADYFSGLFFFEAAHHPLETEDFGPENPIVGNWMGQNYPNPVSSDTTIPFYLPDDQVYSLSLYDLTGREVFRSTNGVIPGERNTLVLNLSHLSSGIYIYKIKSKNFEGSRKLIKN